MSEKKTYNILFLDNDETLGYFSDIGSLPEVTFFLLIDYFMTDLLDFFINNDYSKIIEMINEKIQKLININANFSCNLFKLGYGRPKLMNFFKELKKMKDEKKIDFIIMATGANRQPAQSHILKKINDIIKVHPNFSKIKDREIFINIKKFLYYRIASVYMNWVLFLLDTFENCYNVRDLYDFDYSVRSDDKNPLPGDDGYFYKNIDDILSKFQKKIPSVHFLDKILNIVIVDDQPEKYKSSFFTNLHQIKIKQYFKLPTEIDLHRELMLFIENLEILFPIGTPSLFITIRHIYEELYRETLSNFYNKGISNPIYSKIIEDSDNEFDEILSQIHNFFY